MAGWLEAVRAGQCTRLIVNFPPRHFKSFLASVAFPAFVLGHHPETEILCISYGEKLTDDLAWQCRALMQSFFYQALFPTRLVSEAVDELRTTGGGFRRARSLSGGITGGGADLIIIDDPTKPDDAQSDVRRTTANETFYNTVYSRLNDKEKGVIVLIMQRLHPDDLVAHVMEREHWELLAVPAIAESDEVHAIATPYGRHHVTRQAGEALHPARESIARLKQLRATLPATVFSANYQQRPQPPEGAHIQRQWFKSYAPDELPEDPDAIIQSWDTALKTGEDNSFSVCTTWLIHKQHFYLLDVFRQRVRYNDLKRNAIQLADRFRPTAILIEEQASGFPLLQELKDADLPSEPVPVVIGGKEERLLARINKFAGGFVHVPMDASWLEDYVEELTSFPYTKFSDQVDSTVHALAWDRAGPGNSFSNAMGFLKLMAEQDGITLDGKPVLVKIKNVKDGGTLLIDGKYTSYAKDEIITVTRETAASLCMNSFNGFVRVWDGEPPKSTPPLW